jgi:hypothetical protein
LVTQLIELLDRHSVALVRGSVNSGTTILAILLHNRLLNAGRKVVFVRSWPLESNGYDYRTVLVDFAAQDNLELNRDNLARYNDVVFIIGRAQRSYAHTDFWLEFIKERSGRPFGTKVCLLTTYGGFEKGPVDHPAGWAPVNIDFKQRVGITPSLAKEGPQFGLYYNPDEFKDVLERLNEHSTRPLPLSAKAQWYLFSMTNGHPGAVVNMTSFLKDV